MPSVAVKLYSVFFKFLMKQRLQSWIKAPVDDSSNPYGVTTRPEESVSAPNPSFTDGVATKDIHIDPFSNLSIRIFLPETSLSPPEQSQNKSKLRLSQLDSPVPLFTGGTVMLRLISEPREAIREGAVWMVSAAFDDGMKVLHWLGKQANLAECCKSMGSGARGVGAEFTKAEVQRHLVDALGATMVEPWLAAHGDPSRCVLLGVSCGANIADYVASKAIESVKLIDPVKVVAQVLMYPFFIGSIPTKSETRLANSYFYDMALCLLAWKLFLPEEDFSLDHPAGNPLIPDRSLKRMPPTLTIVAEHDWMRDRAVAYSEALRSVNVDAPVLEYKDAVHEFATLDVLLKTPQAEACAEDIAIWVKKYISFRGHEFSY
ncbi:putative carboxylesterase 16 [Hibiscus syriacus]|uniref:Carboxylesterase 16 n=1 Tax=Hibiscus syriacus TaxID=106335 RepID=A0A6A2ZYN3_HIBSY|nr:putative carboxylesterase 16 [Hibiscus syriacus]